MRCVASDEGTLLLSNMSSTTPAPTAILDSMCLDFAVSQNCPLSTVNCNVSSFLYMFSCTCSFGGDACQQFLPGRGADGHPYSRRCPCEGGPALLNSTTIFAILLGGMILACFIGMVARGRTTKLFMKRKVSVRQDPTTMELATERDYANWREWEVNMRTLEANLAAVTAAATTETNNSPNEDDVIVAPAVSDENTSVLANTVDREGHNSLPGQMKPEDGMVRVSLEEESGSDKV